MDIATARKNAGMTQQALSEAIGVSRAAIANWEGGHARPEVDNAKALGKVLGLTLDEIFSDRETAA